MKAMYFLIDTLFNLYLMVVLLRIWLQLVRADFYNPFSQFIVKATQPVVGPLRSFIPSLGALDTATLVLAFIVASIKIIVISMVFGGAFPPIVNLLITALVLLASQTFKMLFYILIIRAILSWFSQGRNPIEMVMIQLTDPLLAPIRKVIPPIGGLDLSILVAILALQFVQVFISDLTGF